MYNWERELKNKISQIEESLKKLEEQRKELELIPVEKQNGSYHKIIVTMIDTMIMQLKQEELFVRLELVKKMNDGRKQRGFLSEKFKCKNGK